MASTEQQIFSRPVFWKEIYWFTVICLGGFTLAVWALAPRLARYRSALDLETHLGTSVAALSKLEEQYQGGIDAVENDSFYRDEVMRSILGVKEASEEFLKAGPEVSDKEEGRQERP